MSRYALLGLSISLTIFRLSARPQAVSRPKPKAQKTSDLPTPSSSIGVGDAKARSGIGWSQGPVVKSSLYTSFCFQGRGGGLEQGLCLMFAVAALSGFEDRRYEGSIEGINSRNK